MTGSEPKFGVGIPGMLPVRVVMPPVPHTGVGDVPKVLLLSICRYGRATPQFPSGDTGEYGPLPSCCTSTTIVRVPLWTEKICGPGPTNGVGVGHGLQSPPSLPL